MASDECITVQTVDRLLWTRFPRQILLAAIASGLVALIVALLDPGQSDRLSKATAYVGILYIAVTLVIGPLNVLRGAPNPLSTYLRRDFGIIAGVLSLFHMFVGLQVHMRGDFIQYFFYRTPDGIGSMRFDIFGIANHLGLIAALLIFVLLCISNNLSIRRLGPTGWKRIQSWNYIGAVLVVVHGLLYQFIERRTFAFVAYVLAVTAIAATVQFLGFRRRSEQMARQPDFKSE
jgi:methionine sulfoxide reductase heme-binding subunit